MLEKEATVARELTSLANTLFYLDVLAPYVLRVTISPRDNEVIHLAGRPLSSDSWELSLLLSDISALRQRLRWNFDAGGNKRR